jgi:hypothetical protein
MKAPLPVSSTISARLDKFLDNSQAAFANGHMPSPGALKHLESEYRILFDSYRELGNDWINENLLPRQIKAVNFLALGLSADEAFVSAATKYFTPNADETAIAMATFAKAREAFNLVHVSQTPSGPALDELVKMFGSVLGVEVTEGFVMSLRTERMGSILGYALSGLVTADMERWNSNVDGIQAKFKGKNGKPDRDKFLAEVIRGSDKEMVFDFKNDLNGPSKSFKTGCRINMESGAPEGIRGRNRPDHCFVCPPHIDHAGNSVPGRITLGTSTASLSAEGRGYSFATALAATRAMTECEGHQFSGYEVNSYCCLKGSLPTTKLDGSSENKHGVVKMLSKSGEKGEALTQEQIVLLAQVQFLSFFSSSDPSDLVAKNLRGINPHILGCDTLELYELMRRQANPLPGDRTLSLWIISRASKVASLLAQDNLAVGFDVSGQSTLLPILDTLLGVSKNHFKSFPLGAHQKLDDTEKQLLFDFGANLLKLYKRLDDTRSERHTNTLGDIREEGIRWTTPGLLADRASHDSGMANARKGPVIHDKELTKNLSIMREFKGLSSIKAIATGLSKSLSQPGLTRQLFAKAFALVSPAAGSAAVPGWDEAFLISYASSIDHVLSNKNPEKWEGEYEKMENRTQLAAARLEFLREFSKHKAAKLVSVTRDILGSHGDTSFRKLLDREDSPKLQASLHSSAKEIVRLASEDEPDALVAILRTLKEDGERQSPRPKKKM